MSGDRAGNLRSGTAAKRRAALEAAAVLEAAAAFAAAGGGALPPGPPAPLPHPPVPPAPQPEPPVVPRQVRITRNPISKPKRKRRAAPTDPGRFLLAGPLRRPGKRARTEAPAPAALGDDFGVQDLAPDTDDHEHNLENIETPDLLASIRDRLTQGSDRECTTVRESLEELIRDNNWKSDTQNHTGYPLANFPLGPQKTHPEKHHSQALPATGFPYASPYLHVSSPASTRGGYPGHDPTFPIQGVTHTARNYNPHDLEHMPNNRESLLRILPTSVLPHVSVWSPPNNALAG